MPLCFKWLIMLVSVISITACQTSPKKEESTLSHQTFLIGSLAEDKNAGIHKVTFITDKADKTAQLRYEGLVARLPSPSYMAFDETDKKLYVVSGRAKSGIQQLAWHKETGKLKPLAKLEQLGSGACHISLHPSDNTMAIADYRSGEVYKVAVEGESLLKQSAFKNEGHGPHKFQKSSHMHYVEWDKIGRHLYAVDLGTDEIKYFDHQAENFEDKLAVKLQPGDGPRHLTFHPNNEKVYVLNELSNTVVVLAPVENSATFYEVQRVATLAEDAEGYNASSAIKISEDGKYLYAGVRGVNVIMVYTIDEQGMLQHIQKVSVNGNWPRDFSFSQDQDFLLVANQKSNQVNVLRRDLTTGLLAPTPLRVTIPEASYIGSFKF